MRIFLIGALFLACLQTAQAQTDTNTPKVKCVMRLFPDFPKQYIRDATANLNKNVGNPYIVWLLTTQGLASVDTAGKITYGQAGEAKGNYRVLRMQLNNRKWFGGFEGEIVCQNANNKMIAGHLPTKDLVTDILPIGSDEQQGVALIGSTEGGVFKATMDSDKQIIEPLSHTNMHYFKNEVAYKQADKLELDNYDNVWVGSNIGLAVFPLQNTEQKLKPHIKKLGKITVLSKINNDMWVGGLHPKEGSFLYRFSTNGAGTAPYGELMGDSVLKSDEAYESIKFDNTHQCIWLSKGNQLIQYKEKEGKFKNMTQAWSIPNKYKIINILPDNEGNVWLITTGEIYWLKILKPLPKPAIVTIDGVMYRDKDPFYIPFQDNSRALVFKQENGKNINKLAQLDTAMIKNSDLCIEIKTYYNKEESNRKKRLLYEKLTNDRILYVQNYLTQKGIDKERVKKSEEPVTNNPNIPRNSVSVIFNLPAKE